MLHSGLSQPWQSTELPKSQGLSNCCDPSEQLLQGVVSVLEQSVQSIKSIVDVSGVLPEDLGVLIELPSCCSGLELNISEPSSNDVVEVVGHTTCDGLDGLVDGLQLRCVVGSSSCKLLSDVDKVLIELASTWDGCEDVSEEADDLSPLRSASQSVECGEELGTPGVGRLYDEGWFDGPDVRGPVQFKRAAVFGRGVGLGVGVACDMVPVCHMVNALDDLYKSVNPSVTAPVSGIAHLCFHFPASPE